MKLHRLLPILASLALVACLPSPVPTANPPTALPPTSTELPPSTIAAYPAPATESAASSEPSSTPFPSPTLPAFQPTVTPIPFTPLPPGSIIGRHIVQPGETMFCIARGYGVLPAAIAQANGLSQTFFVSPGQVLKIPAVQWTNIAEGPVCATQFQSAFPGLLMPTATLAASATPAGSPLAVRLDYRCIGNCGSKDGTYELHVDLVASGGVQPYTYYPAQSYSLSLPHCVTGQGTATVTSADGQTAQASWLYLDSVCP